MCIINEQDNMLKCVVNNLFYDTENLTVKCASLVVQFESEN